LSRIGYIVILVRIYTNTTFCVDLYWIECVHCFVVRYAKPNLLTLSEQDFLPG